LKEAKQAAFQNQTGQSAAQYCTCIDSNPVWPHKRLLPRCVAMDDDRTEVILGLVRREKPTLRQLLAYLAGARGHFVFAGTPEQVADLIEDWFNTGAADGFNIMPPILPAMLDVFSAEVIPILQKRGLFRTAYTGKTLREHYGLDWPDTFFKAGVSYTRPASAVTMGGV